jgi:hypothetical protein
VPFSPLTTHPTTCNNDANDAVERVPSDQGIDMAVAALNLCWMEKQGSFGKKSTAINFAAVAMPEHDRDSPPHQSRDSTATHGSIYCPANFVSGAFNVLHSLRDKLVLYRML